MDLKFFEDVVLPTPNSILEKMHLERVSRLGKATNDESTLELPHLDKPSQIYSRRTLRNPIFTTPREGTRTKVTLLLHLLYLILLFY